MVDIDPKSLALSLHDVRSKITDRTAAIIVVHPYFNLADIEGFMALSQEFGIPIIEDCAQAHGASFSEQKVGTFGTLGCFSFQSSKLLSCGEGGCVITKDSKLYERIEKLRAHGRCFLTAEKTGQEELIEQGDLLGQNYCMSEFHASILLDRLIHLDSENKIRNTNAEYLNKLLEEMPYACSVNRGLGVNSSIYSFIIKFEEFCFAKEAINIVQNQLSAELNFNWHRLYLPLNQHPLRHLLFKKGFENIALPVSEWVFQTHLAIPHSVLLVQDKSQLDNVAKAIKKIFSYL